MSVKDVNILVVGDKLVGKTSLIRTYLQHAFPADASNSFEDFFSNFRYENQLFHFIIKDTPGGRNFDTIRPLAYIGIQICIICFSLVSPESLKNIENIFAPEVKEFMSNQLYILVGTFSKSRDYFPKHTSEFKAKGWKPIPTKTGEQMKNKIGAAAYIECDAKYMYNVKEVFELAAKIFLHKESIQNIKNDLPNLSKNKGSAKESSKIEDIQKVRSHIKSEKEKISLKISPATINETKNEEKKQNLTVSPSTVQEIIDKVKMKSAKFNQIDLFISVDDEKSHIFIEKMSQTQFFILNKIIDAKHGRVICKKIIIPEDNMFEHIQNAMKEFELFLSIDHPCICKIYGINTSEIVRIDDDDEEVTTVALFLEYLDFDLKDCIMKNILTNTIKTQIAIEIAHGMKYIHKCGLIHRDLKIENIRLNSVLRSKIIDLGLSKINEVLLPSYSFSQSSMVKNFGTAIYMSPELLKEDNYDNKTDVYSFGIVLYHIFVGKLPKYTMKDKMVQKEFPLPNPSTEISEFCINMISNCVSFDPKLRPSFDEILILFRENNYLLASDIDGEYISQCDKELSLFDS